jgi:hypothetical protein
MNGAEPVVYFAFVHHANQYAITDGYNNRAGISQVAGTHYSETGLLRIFDLHKQYRVPLNLHISGTLLESLAWHKPDFLSELKQLAKTGLLELLGSSYGQNMMKFFSYDHNLRQLKEQLRLYEIMLDWDPKMVKGIWIPERLWDTQALSEVLTDPNLPNRGYQYVIIDDRLLFSASGEVPNRSPRCCYDYNQIWSTGVHTTYRIRGGHGLCLIPIANDLRQNIPPRRLEQTEKVKSHLKWLLDVSSNTENGLIAVYADDIEKAAGVGWDPKGPSQFESMLQWVSERKWIRTVKIGEWLEFHQPVKEKSVESGTYFELAKEFGACESFENWYYDCRWDNYRGYYAWAEKRIHELEAKGADDSLIELAWKVLLATVWQTAWHTPKTGAHGQKCSDGGPSAWVKAIASHSRIAAIIAEAAHWMRHEDGHSHAYLQDLDQDGESELIIKNNKLYAVFSPAFGGRLVYLFSIGGTSGKLVIGNPIDDWNLLEKLHDYMDIPPNHPGALSDVGYEHDNFDAKIGASTGEQACAILRNVRKTSKAFGLLKNIKLKYDDSMIFVDYIIPGVLPKLSTEIGFSPDYLRLLRYGSKGVKTSSSGNDTKRWANGDIICWAKLVDCPSSAYWDSPRQARFGHGYLLRITSEKSFRVCIGVDIGH